MREPRVAEAGDDKSLKQDGVSNDNVIAEEAVQEDVALADKQALVVEEEEDHEGKSDSRRDAPAQEQEVPAATDPVHKSPLDAIETVNAVPAADKGAPPNVSAAHATFVPRDILYWGGGSAKTSPSRPVIGSRCSVQEHTLLVGK